MSAPSFPVVSAAPPSAAWLVAFDTSTPCTVVAVGWVDATARTHALVASDDEDQGDRASATVTTRIGQALERAGIGVRSLAAIACGCGPGTFTGTRVAVATAKGLAYGLGRPVVPVSTLAAVASSGGHAGTVLAVLDARRGEVYGGRFRCEPSRGGELPRVEPLDEERVATLCASLDAIAPWPADLRVVGSGVAAHRESLPPQLADATQPLPGPTAGGLWAASVAAWAAGRACHPAALEAVYLRASYAELGVNVPKRPFVKSPFV